MGRVRKIQHPARKTSQTSYLFAYATIGGLLIFVSLVLAACARQRNPQLALDQATRTFERGTLARAQKEAEKGYEDFHRISPDWAWRFRILEANILFWRGMNDRVQPLLSSEPTPPSSTELKLQKLRLEGLAYTSSHAFKEAEQKLQEAMSLCALADLPPCAEVVSAQGGLNMARGRFAEAQRHFERVLASSRGNGQKFLEASALMNLSWAADEQTHFDEALDWSASARQVSMNLDFAGITQAALGNMGWAYYKLGDFEKAKGLLVEAQNRAEELGDLADQIGWLTNAAYVDMDAGDLSIAEQSFRQSLDLARKINSRDDIEIAVAALAFVSEQTGKLEDAKRYADEALSMARADANKRDEVYPRLVQGRLAAQQHDISAAESAFHEVAQAEDSPVFLKWQAEHSLARLYEDEHRLDSADREYKTALSTFEEARANLRQMSSRLPFLTNATAIYDDYIHFLVAQGKSMQALQVAEYSRARTLSEGLGLLHKGTAFAPDPLNAQEIARRAGGAIFFYWLGEKQSYLWAITPQKTILFPLPPASQIDAVVQRYRKSLVGPQDVLATADDDGRALYALLVAPAQTLLAKDARVFVIPDGSLNGLNFETLLVPAPKLHYWIEDATVATASSLRLLAAPRAPRAPNKNLLLLGDAIPPNSDYPGLSKAAVEIDIIKKHFPPTQQQVFSRDRATPPTYLASKPEQFSYVHFVAHGTASRLSPLDSAIVLSKATAEDDSFKLYARDIIQHPLRAELVTISTCYGAGARAYSGEGMVGLSWAFLRAGAHNVIGALWEVSDASTPQLMDELYSELDEGKSPDAALRAAKLLLLHSSSAFQRPFYWAPFQLYTAR
jgi:CHAT domain-containing protein